MPNLREASTDAHRATVESSVADIAAFLQDALGQKLVAFMVGVDNPKTIGRWANEKSGAPQNPEVERKLRDAYQIFRLLLAKESPHTVRAWFVGLNPRHAGRRQSILGGRLIGNLPHRASAGGHLAHWARSGSTLCEQGGQLLRTLQARDRKSVRQPHGGLWSPLLRHRPRRMFRRDVGAISSRSRPFQGNRERVGGDGHHECGGYPSGLATTPDGGASGNPCRGPKRKVSGRSQVPRSRER